VKRSEVIRRLGPAMDEAVKGSLYVAGALHINEAALSAIATALGIEVEPDEEPLPERLEPAGFPWPASWPASRDVAIPEEGWWFASVTKPGGGWEALIASPHKGLADALISAYNGRPRWRTGVPERDGVHRHGSHLDRGGDAPERVVAVVGHRPPLDAPPCGPQVGHLTGTCQPQCP
jgi:hypothetical protein